MDADEQDRLGRGKAACEANRFAEACRLLLPLAGAGDAEAQGIVGGLMSMGLHRYETLDELTAGGGPAPDEATAMEDRDRGARFLEAASAAGVGPASFNLAGLYVSGYGGGTWEERKAKAAELYALAHAQGFTAFGHLMNGGGAGQPYLDILEKYADDKGCPPPGERPV